jgi:hypothetical protein
MSFFAVVRTGASVEFAVDKLDINLWVLPGVFGRQVLLCDVGVRLKLLEELDSNHVVELDLAVPFLANSQSLVDLVPIIRDHQELFDLIFGNTGHRPFTRDNAWFFDDSNGEMRFTPIDTQHCAERMVSRDEDSSIWRVTARRHTSPAGTSLYLRMRLRIRRPGRAWSWQKSERRRSHAISDIRVNELRELPDLAGDAPDFRNDVMDITQVNSFVIVPARFKAGRVNPEPKYVRILESRVWQQYLRRSLGLGNEAFVVTSWYMPDVTTLSPFRAFIEVERRRPTARPTAVRAALVSALVILLGLFLVQSVASLKKSLLLEGAYWTWAFASGLSLGAIIVAWRVVMPFIMNGRWKRATRLLQKYEDFRYHQR